jgi:hypothetical protein
MFTANVTPATVTITTYRWVIDSNVASEDETFGPPGSRTITRTYQNGTKMVSVTVTASDGRTGTGQLAVTCP